MAKKSVASRAPKKPTNSGKHLKSNQYNHVRYNGLKAVTEFALHATLLKFTLAKLQECYPMIEPEVLEYVRRQIVELWQTKSRSECKKISEDRHLKVKLDELDDIIQDAKVRSERGDPNVLHLDKLTPQQVVQATLLDEKKKSCVELDAKIKALNANYEATLAKLEKFSNEVKDNMEDIDIVLKELKQLDSNQISDEMFEDLIKYTVDECL